MRFLVFILSVFSSIWAIAQPSVTANVTNDACGNCTGCITWIATGGIAPYTFLWSPTPANGQGTASACGLCAGTWSITVTDANGDDVTISATIAATTELLVPSGPMATEGHTCNGLCNGIWTSPAPMGGIAPYTVSVSNGGAGTSTPYYAQLSGLCAGTIYDATITDANGCATTLTNINVINGTTPQVVSQTMSGACLGLQQGVATITFDQPIVTAVLYAGQATMNWFGNVLTMSNLAPGPIVYGVLGADPWCQIQLLLDVVQDPSVCGTLNGRVYADMDANCTQDAADPGIPYRTLVAQPGNRTMITNSMGDYEVGLVYGSFTLDHTDMDYSADCLVPFPAPFTLSLGTPTVTIDVAETPLFGADVRAFLGASVHRPAWPAYYSVQAHNETPFAMSNVGLELTYDQLLEFNGATGSPTSGGGGQVQWTIPTLAPFSAVVYQVSLMVPPDPLLLGVVVNATATVTPMAPDSDPANDTYSISRTIVNSFDPNDKGSITNSRLSDEIYFLDIDTYVDHTIRFQNTGTAEAIDIYILDTISALYDLNTLQILGASHPFEPRIEEDRVLRFDFANILLPDSNANEAESHGFISYRLKPVNDLGVGAVLRNTADIFFDINPPIRTNTTELMGEFSVGISERTERVLRIIPNPASTQAQLMVDAGTVVSIFSMDGRMMHRERSVGSIVDLDLRSFAPGLYVVSTTDLRGHSMTGRLVVAGTN